MDYVGATCQQYDMGGLTMSNNILKPCPFCGGEAKVQSFYQNHNVYCTKCHASTEKYFRTASLAIEAWNRRATDENV